MNFFIVNRFRLVAALAFLCMLAVAVLSGWRDVGIDRENYRMMYDGITASEDIVIKLFYAKDLTFLVFVSVANYLSDNAKLAFLLVCAFSMAAKYAAIKKVAPRHLLSFIVLYAVFLAPGLEFAAMRGGLAIGFLMLSFAYRERRTYYVCFSLLAIASHITVLPVVLLGHRKIRGFLSKHPASYLLVAVVVYLISGVLREFFPHGADYEGNEGTIIAFISPLVTLLFAHLVFYRFDRAVEKFPADDAAPRYVMVLRPVINGLIAVGFGISAVVVTAATRYLEIAWCLLLVCALVLWRKSRAAFFGLLALLCYLVMLNIVRMTWIEIISPSLG